MLLPLLICCVMRLDSMFSGLFKKKLVFTDAATDVAAAADVAL